MIPIVINSILDLFRSDALDWTPINDHCKNTKIEVFFGSEPNSRWRNDLFCDNYDNVSTTVVLLSKCNLIHRLDFKRTDFNDFVTNVRRGYDCMSPEYRHFTTYRTGSNSQTYQSSILHSYETHTKSFKYA